MEKPFVSVIIPNYNHARYLEERIQSVLNQTYQNFEIIILDDCSIDNSKEVIEKYRLMPQVTKIVYNETNSGSTFKQWNKGFELAKGELIWIAESDDKCEATFLEELIIPFTNDDKCVLSYCLSMRFDDSGKLYDKYRDQGPDELLLGEKYISFYMSRGTAIKNASSALIKKEVALQIDNRYTGFKGAGDRLFWVFIAEQGHVAIVKKYLNLFRQHGLNSTNKYYLKGINQKEDKYILDYILNKGYITPIQYKIRRIQYIRFGLLSKEFENDLVKRETFKLWNVGPLDMFLAYLYSIYRFIRIKLTA